MSGGLTPSRDDFIKSYEAGNTQLLCLRRVSDLETPVSAYLKVCGGDPYAFLLESVMGNEARGRYSIIGLDPDLLWRVEGGKAAIKKGTINEKTPFVDESLPPLESLEALVAENLIPHRDDLPPMSAGLFGYLGYDMARLMEPSLGSANQDPYDVPDAILIRPRVLVIFDSVRDEMLLVTPVRPQPTLTAERAWLQASARVEDIAARLDRPLDLTSSDPEPSLCDLPDPVSNTPKEDFASMVRRAKDYILSGDIFQVVLSQRFSQPFPLPPLALYRSLRRLDPSPFLYFLNFDTFSVVGSSPEILVRVRDNEVTIRPIAGTRRRGRTQEEDKAMEDELLADPKERAEHLMLLDLGRNDVGRVAEVGSVKVTGRFFIERYSHVMHIVSHVIGRLKKGLTPIEALIAGFPAGTVSGSPKVRAMQIIDELERDKRGPYAGCVGYFSSDGAMDSCIVLRTAIVKDGQIFVQAGAGIVADSDPKLEQKECENKAAAMMRAAREAINFANLGRKGQ